MIINKYFLTIKKFLIEFLFVDILALWLIYFIAKLAESRLPPGYETSFFIFTSVFYALMELIDCNLICFYDLYLSELNDSLLEPPTLPEHKDFNELNIQKQPKVEDIKIKDNFKPVVYLCFCIVLVAYIAASLSN
jgi:hypothetical protein